MSAISIIILYLASLIGLWMGARQFADQYNQPWLPIVVLAGCAFLTARYIARGMR